MINNLNRPNLSFKEFGENWDQYKVSELVVQSIIDKPMDGNHGEIHPKSSDYVSEGIPFVMANDIIDGKINFEKVSKISKAQADSLRKGFALEGDVLLTHKGTVGNTTIVPKIGVDYLMLTPQVTYYRVLDKSKLNSQFLKSTFESFVYRKQLKIAAASGTRPYVGITEQATIKVKLPNIKEQQKIADFLSSVDKKISLLKEKHDLLVQYKKGVMQKLFSQNVRFKGADGNDFSDWVKGTLGDLSDKVSNKNKDESVTNVLTNSAKSGIVSQTDYFKKDIANQSNLGGYSIVGKNDFVYNPRISELAPVGPIKRNHIGQGVMSPLYTVFRFKDESVLDYLELYFETTQWHRYMNSIANFGARHDRMNITMGDFFNLPIPIPSKDEMVKIVGFIQSLNKKVDLVAQQLKQTQTFKKGLLQQMFV